MRNGRVRVGVGTLIPLLVGSVLLASGCDSGSQLESTLGDVEERVSALESKIDELESSNATLQETVEELSEKVEELEGDLGDLQSTVEDHEGRIEDLELR